MDEVVSRVYLKPGIWISLGLHLLLFAFLFFYGNQKLRQQDSFVELAEFNLEQAIKEVDTTPVSSDSVNKKPTLHVPRPESVTLSNQLTPDKPISRSLVAQQKTPSENTQTTNHATSSTSSLADERGVLSENNGWLNTKEKAPLTASSDQAVATETKKVVIAARSSAESDVDNLTGWGRYGHQLSIEAAKMKKYPMMAVSSRMQGTVIVSVSVSQSGDVLVGLKRSSGYDLLDEQAVTMVSRAAKNIAIPAELKNTAKELFVPIQFSL